MAERSRATLGRVLDDLGLTLLELELGRIDPARQIGSVVIYDPYDPPLASLGDLVLGVGLSGIDEVAGYIRELGAAGAAGLILKPPIDADPELHRAVEQTGVPIFALTAGASWAQVAAMLNASLGLSDGTFSALSGIEDRGDLFALANAIAALVEAPVTIEDLNSRVIAFSADQRDADDYRKNAVLGRQVSGDITLRMKRAGLFDRVYASEQPIVVSAADIGFAEDMLPRVVVAIRAGTEILGTIWAILSSPLTPEREQALVDVAKPAALHMLRSRIAMRSEDRTRSELVGTLIAGGPAARDAAARHGHFLGPACVVAATIRDDPDVPEITAELHRLASALALHVSVMHPHAIAAQLGHVVYAILPLPAGAPAPASTPPALTSVREFLRRIRARTGVVVGVGSAVAGPTELSRSRDDAERALRVLRGGNGASIESRVAEIDDVQVESMLLELGDIVAAENRTLSGPVARLLEYDRANQADLVATLRAWLDAFGDAAVAAEALHIHPNTLRYRVRRLAEIGGIDLSDPDARFGAMLQLRLFDV